MLTQELYQYSQEYQQSLPKSTFPAVHKCKCNPHIYANQSLLSCGLLRGNGTDKSDISLLFTTSTMAQPIPNSCHCKNSPSAYLHKCKKTAPWSRKKHSADCSFVFVYLHSRQEVGLVSYLLDIVLQIAYGDRFCRLQETRLKWTKGESFSYLKCWK